jgi:sulfide:quinone oxidoreductase
MSVLAPFAAGGAQRRDLARLVAGAGATLRRGSLDSVDADARVVHTSEGAAIPYDVLLLAVGARRRAPAPGTLAFGTHGSEEAMHGLVQDVEAGYARRIAFVVPAGTTWPLPLYELALMLAERAWETGMSPSLLLVTPEARPLGLFGPEASQSIGRMLDAARVQTHSGAHADIERPGRLVLRPQGERLEVDRIVTLPVLEGPAIAGLPHDREGFVPVDRHGRVRGADGVYAAGDATNFAIKQGGIACQQADAAAEAIAAGAGAAIEPAPFTPVLRGVLLTERDARWMRRDAGGASGDRSAVTSVPLWWPPTKIAGRELARHLQDIHTRPHPEGRAALEIDLPVSVG